ncbi:glucan biosynthesis protein [Methylocystis sp. IM4]|uniref:glucan biosynthesis protein n=1 Tax=Methylocystis sp. IM4 TaxID=3136560 RepID=UPI00311A27C5
MRYSILPSVAGIYRFTVRPGEATLIDTELTLFSRTTVDHYGLAGFAAASLHTPLDLAPAQRRSAPHGGGDQWHPDAHRRGRMAVAAGLQSRGAAVLILRGS